jgi:hypothetical protein
VPEHYRPRFSGHPEEIKLHTPYYHRLSEDDLENLGRMEREGAYPRLWSGAEYAMDDGLVELFERSPKGLARAGVNCLLYAVLSAQEAGIPLETLHPFFGSLEDPEIYMGENFNGIHGVVQDWRDRFSCDAPSQGIERLVIPGNIAGTGAFCLSTGAPEALLPLREFLRLELDGQPVDGLLHERFNPLAAARAEDLASGASSGEEQGRSRRILS